MKKLIWLTCVATLVVWTSVCLAGEMEDNEEAALKSEILKPIMDKFADKDSITRVKSLAWINTQKELGTDISKAGFTESAAQKVLSEISEVRLHEMSDFQDRLDNLHKANKEDLIATGLSDAWGHQIAVCGIYTDMVLTAFEFNHMNYIASKKEWPFKEAVVVMATPRTKGNHIFVLVEGKSGAVFAVDPWIRMVKKLDHVTKLSDIDTTKSEKMYPDYRSLNELFGQTYKGKVYYDKMYTGEDTRWFLSRRLPKHIQDLVHTYTLSFNGIDTSTLPQSHVLTMRDIYNYLNGYFPVWRTKYEDLFKSGGAKAEEPEHKKPDGEDNW